MKKILLAAASVVLLAGPALAQGNSPYNRSGPQAGGPLGGMERRQEGVAMERGAMAPERPMMQKRRMKRKSHHRRMKHRM